MQVPTPVPSSELYAGQESNATRKLYDVIVDGELRVVAMADMTRAYSQLTKPAIKHWLHTVSRQQSLGVKGMTSVWLVHDSLLKEWDVPNNLPKHIEVQLQKTAKRREQRQRARQRQQGTVVPPEGALPRLPTAETLAGQPHPPAVALATLLPAQSPQQRGLGADSGTTLASEGGPVAPPEETLEDTEARLEQGTPKSKLKRAIFLVLKEAGPPGLGVSDIMTRLKQHGFDWGANTRGGKSSIASTCRHDSIFLRLGAGHFTLRALPGALDHVPATASCSKQQLEAVKAVCTLEAKQAATQARMTSGSQPFVKNTFKCSRCMRLYHPDGSPLVLCDYCPKAFHLECIGEGSPTVGDMAVGSWQCPKCVDKQAANKQKLQDIANKKKEALERVAMADRRRAGSAGKRTELDGRDRRKTETRAGKDMFKRASLSGFEGDQLAAVDDVEAAQEEERALAQLEAQETQADEPDPATAAVAWVARTLADASRSEVADVRALKPVGDLGGEEGAAGHQLAQLRMRVRGPPDPHWVTDDPRTAKLLREALSVADFVHSMQPLLLCSAFELRDLLQAVHTPAATPLLPHLYTVLLCSCVKEQVAVEAPLKRSRAKRWGRVLDRFTWPEVLRRYLLATRAGQPMTDEQLSGCDVTELGSDRVAVYAALQLGRSPWWVLPPDLHTLILSALCDDIAQGSRLRKEVNTRLEEIAALHVERQQSHAENKKREKEHARVRQDKLHALRDIEARAEAGNLSGDAKPTAAELAEAEALRQELLEDGEDDKRGPAGGKGRLVDAEFDRRLCSRSVRADMLGWDRMHRSYWWLQCTSSVLWVFGPEGGRAGVYTTREQLNCLFMSLLDWGARERSLSQVGAADHVANLKLSFKPEKPANEGAEMHREHCVGTGGSQQLNDMVEAAKASLQNLLQLCEECALSVEQCKQLRATIDEATADTLFEVVRQVESRVARFSEGLPKEADDNNMVAAVEEVEVYRAEFVLPAAPQKIEDQDQGKGSSVGGVGLQRRGSKGTEGEDGEDGEVKPGEGPGNGEGKPPAATQIVAALDELDDSDAEPESKSGSTYDEMGNRYPNKPLRLWRTRRDRTVWLKDVKRAQLNDSACGAVFCCATLLDRARPMAVRILNRINMQRASDAQNAEGNDDHSEGANDAGADEVAAGASATPTTPGIDTGTIAAGGSNIVGAKRELDATAGPTGGPQTRQKLNRPLWDTMFRYVQAQLQHETFADKKMNEYAAE